MSLAKLCYRFVNTHTTVAHQDGTRSCFTELLMYDPKPFFAQTSTGTSVFDFAEMKRWVALLNDTDATTGLPKTMRKEKGRWSRMTVRATLELEQQDEDGDKDGDGGATLHVDLRGFEYDSGTDDWSRLRTSTTVSYVQKDGRQDSAALPPERAAAGIMAGAGERRAADGVACSLHSA